MSVEETLCDEIRRVMVQIAEDTLDALGETFTTPAHVAALDAVRASLLEELKAGDELERMLEEEFENVTQQ
jgi:hypothetical protein